MRSDLEIKAHRSEIGDWCESAASPVRFPEMEKVMESSCGESGSGDERKHAWVYKEKARAMLFESNGCGCFPLFFL